MKELWWCFYSMSWKYGLCCCFFHIPCKMCLRMLIVGNHESKSDRLVLNSHFPNLIILSSCPDHLSNSPLVPTICSKARADSGPLELPATCRNQPLFCLGRIQGDESTLKWPTIHGNPWMPKAFIELLRICSKSNQEKQHFDKFYQFFRNCNCTNSNPTW